MLGKKGGGQGGILKEKNRRIFVIGWLFVVTKLYNDFDKAQVECQECRG